MLQNKYVIFIHCWQDNYLSFLTALLEAFDRIDTAHQHSLNQDGVRQVLQLIGQNPTKTEMRSCFKQYGKLSSLQIKII